MKKYVIATKVDRQYYYFTGEYSNNLPYYASKQKAKLYDSLEEALDARPFKNDRIEIIKVGD